MLTDTSVHAALGESGAMDLAMVRRAVDNGVREDERLDWKQGLYPADTGKDEFAKDVAAFANSRGGIIVIGVAEERATGRASALVPVKPTDAVERQMRAWLHTRINPAVPGIQFAPLVDDGGEGVLVVVVPESPDMPHMIGSDKSCGFPVRIGTQTQWMREHDLERSYRQRFDRRQSDEQALATLIERATDHLDLSEGCWIVAAARPTVASSVPLAREDVQRLLGTALDRYEDLVPNQVSSVNFFKGLGDSIHNPRVGLHKWVAAHRAGVSPSDRSDSAYVEVHNDGSVVVALLAGGWGPSEVEGRNTVPEFVVTAAMIALVNLVVARAEGWPAGQVLIRVDLARADNVPYAFFMEERHKAGQPSWSLDVSRFIPVEEIVDSTVDIEGRRSAATRLIGGVSAQFGVQPGDFGYRWKQ